MDDHEIVGNIGRAERLAIKDFVPKLMRTEVGPNSGRSRFRPVYEVLRFTEMWAWGKQPGLWYIAHLAMLVFFMAAIWLTATPGLSFVPAGLLAAYTVTFAWWGDIFARLGPSEAYATFGLGLWLIGCYLAYQSCRSRSGWLLVLLGMVVAAGSKENFVLMIVPSSILFGRCVLRKSVTWWNGLCLLLSAACCGWISYVVLMRMLPAGVDFYQNSITPASRLTMAIDALPQSGLIPFYLSAAVFAALWRYFRKRRPEQARASAIAGAFSVGLIGLYLSQVVFYNGDWPTGTRYDLPGMLCGPIMLFVILWYVQRFVPRSTRLGTWHGGSVLPLLIGLAALGTHFKDISVLRSVSQENVRQTVRFTSAIEGLSALATRHADFPIVLGSSQPWDYEAVISYHRFLASNGVSNPLYLLWTNASPATTAATEWLNTHMETMSQQGLEGTLRPLAELQPAGSECILVLLSGEPTWPCDVQIDGQYRNY